MIQQFFTGLFWISLSMFVVAQEKENSLCEDKQFSPGTIPESMTVAEKKLRFRCLIQPAIIKVYSDLTQQYEETLTYVKNGDPKLENLKEKYSVETNEDLLTAMKPHPRSITMAQAAIESAWATSRFFRVANNVFGVWSFNENEPRVAAGKKRGDKTIWVKKYPSITASIEDYYLVLARGRAFSEFRSQKMKNPDPFLLVEKLANYSERKAEYGEELAAMIRYNNFDTLDNLASISDQDSSIAETQESLVTRAWSILKEILTFGWGLPVLFLLLGSGFVLFLRIKNQNG